MWVAQCYGSFSKQKGQNTDQWLPGAVGKGGMTTKKHRRILEVIKIDCGYNYTTECVCENFKNYNYKWCIISYKNKKDVGKN